MYKKGGKNYMSSTKDKHKHNQIHGPQAKRRVLGG